VSFLKVIPQKISTLLKSLLAPDIAAEKSLLQVTDLPTWRELLQRCQGFPDNYAGHFEPEALTEVQNLLGREAELETLGLVLQRWDSGRACSVALIGPEGSGKTSLINGFIAMAGDRYPTQVAYLPHRVGCVKDLLGIFSHQLGSETPFTSVQELIQHILSRPRQILVLEFGHNLTLRLTSCREALQAFFYILIETRQHWMWIVSFRRFPWERLGMTAAIPQYFTHQVTTSYHDQQQIREIIETRHNQTGLTLEYLGEAEAESPQEELAEAFYKNLFAATGGNVAAALYYWLLSLEHDPESGVIRVRPLGSVEVGHIRSLERSYHFTLAEIVWHGGLSCHEHQELFLQTSDASRLQLEYLTQLSLLVTSGVDDEGFPDIYRLNPMYFKQVITLLESLHLLY